jgi:hypothetical protein
MNYCIETCRKPVVIDLDNDKDDTGNEEDAQAMDEDEPSRSDEDNDLTNLNSVSLKKKIISEVVISIFFSYVA